MVSGLWSKRLKACFRILSRTSFAAIDGNDDDGEHHDDDDKDISMMAMLVMMMLKMMMLTMMVMAMADREECECIHIKTFKQQMSLCSYSISEIVMETVCPGALGWGVAFETVCLGALGWGVAFETVCYWFCCLSDCLSFVFVLVHL